jgi:hypothetical protein
MDSSTAALALAAMEAPLLQIVDILKADPSFGSATSAPGVRINLRRLEKNGACLRNL